MRGHEDLQLSRLETPTLLTPSDAIFQLARRDPFEYKCILVYREHLIILGPKTAREINIPEEKVFNSTFFQFKKLK